MLSSSQVLTELHCAAVDFEFNNASKTTVIFSAPFTKERNKTNACWCSCQFSISAAILFVSCSMKVLPASVLRIIFRSFNIFHMCLKSSCKVNKLETRQRESSLKVAKLPAEICNKLAKFSSLFYIPKLHTRSWLS